METGGAKKKCLNVFILQIILNLTCCFPVAGVESISFIARITDTVWIVIPDRASGKRSTHSRTRVFALLRDTSQVRGTLLVDRALRFALNIGISPKTRKTLTRSCSCPLIANCIDATRRRIAGVNDFWPRWLRCDSVASVEWVPLVPLVANTDGYVVSDPTISIDAAKTRTRVLASFVDASKLL